MSVFRRETAIWSIALMIVCVGGCNYDPKFDTLSAFPANLDRKSASEVDFVEVDSVDEIFPVVEESIVEITPEAPAAIEPTKGVKGFPYERDQKTASGGFVRLDEYLTGIERTVKMEMSRDQAHLLSTPFCSVGIAVGDLVGDSLPDIFVADQQTGGRLLENVGGFEFKDVTAVAGIKQVRCWGVTPNLVDINSDGLLDVYLCCYNDPNRLFVNQGRKFVEQSERYALDFRGASSAASFADFDRDGDLDLYLTTHRLRPSNLPDKLPVDREPGKPPRIKEEYREANHLIPYRDGRYVPVDSGQYDRVYLNQGSRFVDVTDQELIPKQPYRGNAARWFDFDEDGWPDIFVANDQKDPDVLLRNLGPDAAGDIRFEDVTQQMLSVISWHSKATCLSDLNGDGRLDLLVAGDADVQRAKRSRGRGNLFGNDGDAWFLETSQPTVSFGNSAYLNMSAGPFVEMAKSLSIASSGSTSAMVCGDFDNDGREEIWFGNGSVRPWLDNDLNAQLRQKMDADSLLEAEDFWFDQASVPSPDVVVRYNDQQLFEAVAETWDIKQSTLTRACATADFDNDGDLDVVTLDHDGEVLVFRNSINAENTIQFQLVGSDSNRMALGASIRVFGEEADMVRSVSGSGGFLSSQAPIIHFGVGESDAVSSVEIVWPDGNKQILKSLPANYRYVIQQPGRSRAVGRGLKMELDRTLFASEDVDLERQPELPFDDFDPDPMLPFKFSQNGPGHSWGDIDGDGDDDLFVGGAAFEKSMLYENRGRFELVPIQTTAFDEDVRCEDMGAVLFDCDGDGDVDLFVVSGGVESKLSSAAMLDRLYLNDGQGKFQKSEGRLPAYRNSGGTVSVVDFDKDGALDLFVGGRVVPGVFPATPKSVLLKNQDGKFEIEKDIAPELSDVGMVTGSCIADINGDSWPDLMVTCQFGQTRCFKNERGTLVDVSQEAGLSGRFGWFNSIAIGDVDNDGDSDFLVGNLGTNTEYQANEETLFRWERLKSDTAEFLLESYSDNQQRFPLRSLDWYRQSHDGLFDFVDTNEHFSEMPIEMLFAQSDVKNVQSVALNSTESGVWINESSGSNIRFRFKPLPLIAQSSPIFGCQLVDVNGDGNLDLFAVQNLREVNPMIERMGRGRGLLLLGDGDGEFKLPEKEAGVLVNGSGRSATSVDLNADGRCDLVAATNDRGFQFYSNRSLHFPFAMDLRQVGDGKPYLGAKVTLTFADGTQQLHQIVSNSGYLSQSAPIVYSGLKNNKEVDTIRIEWPDGTSKTGSVNSLLRNR